MMAQLNNSEFTLTPSGTKAKKVKYFDGDGNQQPSTYILLDDLNFDDELNDACQVADGYFYEVWNVTRK